jgi:hypothetical protein
VSAIANLSARTISEVSAQGYSSFLLGCNLIRVLTLTQMSSSSLTWTRFVVTERIAVAVIALFSLTVSAGNDPPSNILEKKFSFPSPVQWSRGDLEISLLALAWGPANSPEMISKGCEVRKSLREKPGFFADRSYALALHFRARVPEFVSSETYSASGLVLIKDVEGNLEAPLELTPLGFLPFSGSPGVYDVHFARSNATDYWDFFPVSPNQREFLLQTPTSASMSVTSQRLSFRIVLRDDDFVIFNASPPASTTCLNFTKNFTGTIGAGSNVNLQLKRESTTISGAEQYVRVGTTLWLKGEVDPGGNFVIEESYPKSRTTGIFKGKFSRDCQLMAGYFSKPDGSGLQPFEFREVQGDSRTGTNGSNCRRE